MALGRISRTRKATETWTPDMRSRHDVAGTTR
jgi:hypothetical protein